MDTIRNDPAASWSCSGWSRSNFWTIRTAWLHPRHYHLADTTCGHLPVPGAAMKRTTPRVTATHRINPARYVRSGWEETTLPPQHRRRPATHIGTATDQSGVVALRPVPGTCRTALPSARGPILGDPDRPGCGLAARKSLDGRSVEQRRGQPLRSLPPRKSPWVDMPVPLTWLTYLGQGATIKVMQGTRCSLYWRGGVLLNRLALLTTSRYWAFCWASSCSQSRRLPKLLMAIPRPQLRYRVLIPARKQSRRATRPLSSVAPAPLRPLPRKRPA